MKFELLPDERTLHAVLDETAKEYLIGVMRRTNWNVAHASVLAGMERTNFYRVLARHGINANELRKEE